MEEEEGVDEKDGDEIIIGVGSDVAEIKLRYVESMFLMEIAVVLFVLTM